MTNAKLIIMPKIEVTIFPLLKEKFIGKIRFGISAWLILNKNNITN